MVGPVEAVDGEGDVEVKDKLPRTAVGGLWKLYISRFLTAWGDRMWSFGLGLFLLRVWPENLLIVAINGLGNGIAAILFGAFIGTWIDKTGRLTAAKTFLVVQNTSVALACAFLATYFQWNTWWVDLIGSVDTTSLSIAIVTISIAIVSTLASMGSKIVVEKDWIVVISGGDLDRLATTNSIFRTIDLVCLTLTPTLAGFLFSYTSYFVCAAFIGVWNVVSVALEFVLLVSIYKEFPALSNIKPASLVEKEKSKGIFSSLTGSVQGWSTYFTHPTVFAGLGLAFLYMTVLGFDNVTWGFVLMQCVDESLLGGLVAFSALVGVAGAAAFPFFRRCLGVERAGVLGMALLVTISTACVVSIWLPGSPFNLAAKQSQHFDLPNNSNGTADSVHIEPLESSEEDIAWDCEVNSPNMTSVAVLLSGIIVAKFGLWLADLSISQIQQEQVEEEHRGVIGGVQSSLQQLFDMAKFLLVIFMPDPNMFGILILASFAFVSLGAVSMTTYAVLRGKFKCCGNGGDSHKSRRKA